MVVVNKDRGNDATLKQPFRVHFERLTVQTETHSYMLYATCWIIATVALIVFSAELASEVTESNLTYQKSKWLGAFTSGSEHEPSPGPSASRYDEISPRRDQGL